jgi:hypothetical protein
VWEEIFVITTVIHIAVRHFTIVARGVVDTITTENVAASMLIVNIEYNQKIYNKNIVLLFPNFTVQCCTSV